MAFSEIFKRKQDKTFGRHEKAFSELEPSVQKHLMDLHNVKNQADYEIYLKRYYK